MIRVLLLSFLGGLIAALTMFSVQFYALTSGGADLTSVTLPTLLFRVMEIQYYGIFGAVIGAFVAPFPPEKGNLISCIFWWTITGMVVGSLTPSFLTIEFTHFPKAAELYQQITFEWRYFLTGALVGLILGIIQIAYIYFSSAGSSTINRDIKVDSFTNVDTIVKNYWSDRADDYLTNREKNRNARKTAVNASTDKAIKAQLSKQADDYLASRNLKKESGE